MIGYLQMGENHMPAITKEDLSQGTLKLLHEAVLRDHQAEREKIHPFAALLLDKGGTILFE